MQKLDADFIVNVDSLEIINLLVIRRMVWYNFICLILFSFISMLEDTGKVYCDSTAAAILYNDENNK